MSETLKPNSVMTKFERECYKTAFRKFMEGADSLSLIGDSWSDRLTDEELDQCADAVTEYTRVALSLAALIGGGARVLKKLNEEELFHEISSMFNNMTPTEKKDLIDG